MGKSIKPKLVLVREPSGRRSRSQSRPGEEFPPTAVKRLRDEAVAGMATDARWGTELGRLFLTHKIDGAAFIAGERWAALAVRYHLAIGTPPIPRSAALERGSRHADVDPDTDAGAWEAARDRRTIRAMQESHTALLGGGKLAEAAVRAVCERNEMAAEYELEHLARGLAWLVEFWGLTRLASNGRKLR